jgi:hypothetical protein
MFLLYVLEFQNMKNETPKWHHGDKPLKHEKSKTLFTLNWVPLTNNKIQKIMSYDKYLITIMYYDIDVQYYWN